MARLKALVRICKRVAAFFFAISLIAWFGAWLITTPAEPLDRVAGLRIVSSDLKYEPTYFNQTSHRSRRVMTKQGLEEVRSLISRDLKPEDGWRPKTGGQEFVGAFPNFTYLITLSGGPEDCWIIEERNQTVQESIVGQAQYKLNEWVGVLRGVKY